MTNYFKILILKILSTPVCKLWQAPYRDSPFEISYQIFIHTLPYLYLLKIYLTKIVLLEILPYKFFFLNARKFYLIKDSVNRLYVDMT